MFCSNDAEGSVSISVEDEPIVSCDTDDELICSGDDYSFTLTAGSPLESAIGSDLYYSVTTTTTTIVSTGTGSAPSEVTTTEIVLAEAGGNDFTGTTENMSGFNQTISITATPFYSDGTPTEIGDACTGEPVTCSTTVKTMPMVTFGGDESLCEGEDGFLTFTGPPNGRAAVSIRNGDGDFIGLGFIGISPGGSLTVPVTNAQQTLVVRIFAISDGPFLSPNSCTGGSTFDFTVNVTPTPEAAFDESDETVCEGDDVVICITGTPNATVGVDAATNDDLDQDVDLDGDGNGCFTVSAAEADETFSLTTVSLVSLDGNGEEFTCTGDGDEGEFELTVNPAPVGALVSNAILCAGDAPEVQFNITNGVEGPFAIVVNGETFSPVMNGMVLDFTGTDLETLDVTTTFTLESITQLNGTGGGAPCGDLLDPTDLPDVDVVVNTVPEVSLDPFETVICSGDVVNLVATGTPLVGEAGNALYFEITVNGDFGPLTDGQVLRIPATEGDDLNAALGIEDEDFINGSFSETATLSLTIVPYYESNPGDQLVPVWIAAVRKASRGNSPEVTGKRRLGILHRSPLLRLR